MVAAEARGGRLYLPGDTVVAQTVADDFRDFVLLGDRLCETSRGSDAGKFPADPLKTEERTVHRVGFATGYRRGAGTVRLKSMRCRTLTDMHDRDVVGVESAPSRQIIEEPCRRGIGVEQCPGDAVFLE